MKAYKLKIDAEAFQDIKEISDWYNKRSTGLGTKFRKNVRLQISSLKHGAYNHAIRYHDVRYHDVRCMLLKKFPFLIHYIIDEADTTVIVFAIIHTSRNPRIWEQRSENI